MALLEIENLTVEFKTSSGFFRAVDGTDVDVPGPFARFSETPSPPPLAAGRPISTPPNLCAMPA